MKSMKINKKKILYLLILFALLLGGMVLRLYDLKDAPLDFHPTRQLWSAIKARGMYYSITTDANIPQWQRTAAINQWKTEGLVEPTLLEWLVAYTYKIMGGINLWVSRIYTSLFWLIAALGIYLLSCEIAGEEGALAGVALFLFYPYGVIASRSFQPETLFIAALVFCGWSVLQWEKQRSLKWAIISGLLGGLAILFKAVAVFFVAGIWLGLLLSKMKPRDILRNTQLWLAAFLSVIPYAIFMYYAFNVVGGYSEEFSLRFFPSLWFQIGFYLRWIGTLRQTISLEWLVIGLIGVLMIRENHHRWMLIGLWIGYILFGFTLSYHISTHDYYNLPIFIMVAIGLAVVIQHFVNISEKKKWVKPLLLTILFFAVSVYAVETRSDLKRTNYSSEVAFWEDLGQTLGHDARVVALSEDYGYRLEYWGWITPNNWMTTSDINVRKEAGQGYDFAQTFTSEIKNRDYFVVTMMDELAIQVDLKNQLYTHYPVVSQSSRDVIFDLRNPK